MRLNVKETRREGRMNEDSKICWCCEHFAHCYASGGFCKIKTGDLPERAVDALDTCENFKERNRGGEE